MQQISADQTHVLILLKNGSVFGCGANDDTEMSGDSGMHDRFLKPTLLKLPEKIVSIATTRHGSLFLAKKSLYVSGTDNVGELGAELKANLSFHEIIVESITPQHVISRRDFTFLFRLA